MKNFFIATLFLLMVAFQASAGVGGISGGEVPNPKTVHGKLSGGHILFKKYSTTINPLNSRTLCFDGESFKARINGCQMLKTQREREECTTKKAVEITQPMVDTKIVCKSKEKGEICQVWEELPLIQSPVRKIQVLDNEGQEVSAFEYRVPDCY